MIELIDANNIFRRDFEHVDPTKTQARLSYEGATSNHIYVWDGYDHNARRRKLFDGYKRRDQTMGEDIFAGLNLMREILSHSPAHQIECKGWEADDVICTIALHFAKQGVEVNIQTNDLDYYQIMHQPGIHLDGVKKPDFPAEYVPLYKTLCGDNSDKIPGIPGFGPKKFEALSILWPDLCEMFRQKNVDKLRTILGVTPKIKLWLSDDANMALLDAYWQIVHIIPVPFDVIEEGWRVGKPNPVEAEKLFTRFML